MTAFLYNYLAAIAVGIGFTAYRLNYIRNHAAPTYDAGVAFFVVVVVATLCTVWTAGGAVSRTIPLEYFLKILFFNWITLITSGLLALLTGKFLVSFGLISVYTEPKEMT